MALMAALLPLSTDVFGGTDVAAIAAERIAIVG
jgi:hypothetical protein